MIVAPYELEIDRARAVQREWEERQRRSTQRNEHSVDGSGSGGATERVRGVEDEEEEEAAAAAAAGAEQLLLEPEGERRDAMAAALGIDAASADSHTTHGGRGSGHARDGGGPGEIEMLLRHAGASFVHSNAAVLGRQVPDTARVSAAGAASEPHKGKRGAEAWKERLSSQCAHSSTSALELAVCLRHFMQLAARLE